MPEQPPSPAVEKGAVAFRPVDDVVTDHERMVLVGRRWPGGEVTDWAWWNKPYDDVMRVIKERATNYRPGSSFEVIEVKVQRRTTVTAEVTVLEKSGGDFK